MKIFNFTNRMLCEYQTIFPTVVNLLDHLLFTNGNGYGYDAKRGMIFDACSEKKQYIDQYPEMSNEDWKNLIADCHAKERKFLESYARGRAIDEAELAEECAKYKRISVDAAMFSEDELFYQLRHLRRTKEQVAFERGHYPSFVRPYPLSPGYADIFKLNEQTPGWFLQIAYNLCRAWVRFLDEEIKYKSYWVKPSERPSATEKQIQNSAAMAELFEAIKEDPEYDGWLDKERKEPESDYGDLTWTTKHREMLAKQAQRIGSLLVAYNGFKVGDKVVVKERDPFWTYAGCAEPMPGMKGEVTSITIAEPAAFGKIEIKFEPEVLGYDRKEDDGSDERITLYLRPWILEKK